MEDHLLPTKSAIDRSFVLKPDDGDGALSLYGSHHDIMAAKQRSSLMAGVHSRVSQLSQRLGSGSGYLPMGSQGRSTIRSGYMNVDSGQDDQGLYSAGSVPGFNPPPLPGGIPAPPPPPPLPNH